MAKYSVKVRKYFDLQIPVEGYDPNEIRQRIWKLIDKGDMEVIFGDIHDEAWGYDIRFVRKISFEEFEDLADCTEVVHWDGTHSWRE